jgi:predicted ABC-class ATPase
MHDGVTLIVGGGYHGKSTLLSAIERGVYDHIPGDGRELCVTVPSAMRIRAEEGRRVASVDISAFIKDLPDGRPTSSFSTDDASGSTSQAAGIAEAIEVGSSLLLVDEDTAATNFMIRDKRMQLLVHKDHEPIVPFVDRVQELHRSFGISTILVIGGSGDYLDVADLVLAMNRYEPEDVTREAREVATLVVTGRDHELPGPLSLPPHRVPDATSIDPSRGRKSVAIKARRKDTIAFGREEIDLGSLSGPTELAQVRAIGDALHRLSRKHLDGETTLKTALSRLEEELQADGLDVLRPFGAVHGNYAMPRTVDIAAALNRLRILRISRMIRGD